VDVVERSAELTFITKDFVVDVFTLFDMSICTRVNLKAEVTTVTLIMVHFSTIPLVLN
jgi:hypothetical protein